jgi:non-specific serine/threonine protein kinase
MSSEVSFGQQLRQHRLAAGLTQEAMAERAGLSVHGLQKLERGVTRPYRDTLRRLLLALRLAPEEEAELRAAAEPAPRLMARHGRPAGRAAQHNLPISVTSFIGREQELVELEARLQEARALTLTGVGGCGKTRLAHELARTVLERYSDGVWLVELGPVSNPELVPNTLATVMGVRETIRESVTTALAAALRARRLLLVLDNCEHLLEASARLVDAIIRSCPEVRVLATSREPLGIAGEVAWRVLPLATPDPRHLPPLPELEQAAAIRLFVERARAVEPHFALTEQNAAAVAQACRRLDGIPLALELAAARVRALTAEQLVARLDQRFRLLTGGSRSATPRHQTLRATLDWSYELLDERERALFRRLAVFASGWTLEAAEAVAEGEPIQPSDVLDLLTSLVDKSLVVTDPRGAEERYGFLETVRHYAEDQLVLAGEAITVRNRHLDWCLDRVANLASGRTQDLDRLVAELDNIRSALTWAASDDATTGAGLKLLGDLGLRWSEVFPTFAEGWHWLEVFLVRSPVPSASRASALLWLDHTLRFLHEFELARRAANEALAIYRELRDEQGIAEAMSHVGMVVANQGDYQSGLRHVEEALASARGRGDPIEICRRLIDIGVICIASGDFRRARIVLTESAHLGRQDPTRRLAHNAVLRLAILDRLEGDYPRARARVTEARRLREQESGSPVTLPAQGDLMRYLEEANLARAEGRFDEGRALILGFLRRLQERAEVGFGREAMAMLGINDIAVGAYVHGVTLLGAASNVEGPISTVHIPNLRIEAPVNLELARAALGEDGYTSAWDKGQAMTLDHAIAYVLEAVPAIV